MKLPNILQFKVCTLFLFFSSILTAQNVGINNPNPDRELDVIGLTRLQHASTSGSNPQLELLSTGPAASFNRLKFSQANVSEYWMLAARNQSTGVDGRFNLFTPTLGNVLTATDEGKIGINEGNPNAMFHVDSRLDIDPLRVQYKGSTKFVIFRNSSMSFGTNNVNVSENDAYFHYNVGIGVSNPTQRLDINGTIKSTGFQMPTGAFNGKVLTSDQDGNASWQFLTGDNLGNHFATQDLNMNTKRLRNLPPPQFASDAATKDYVDFVFNNVPTGSGVQDNDGDTRVETNTQDEILFTANNATVGVLGEKNFELSFGENGIFIGEGAGTNMSLTTTLNSNVGIGFQALNSATSGFGNVAIGIAALSSSINRGGQVAIGNSALSNCVSAGNTAVGNVALLNLETGDNNTALGSSALSLNSTVENSVGVGYWAGRTGPSFSVSVGSQANQNTNATHVVGIGYMAGFNHDGNHNVAIGSRALSGSTGNGGFNVAIGSEASFENGAGDSNVSIGYHALRENTFGDDNVAIGYHALKNMESGTGHTSLGYKAGLGFINGGTSTSVGHLTNQSLAAGAQINNTALGNMATNTAGNQVRIGNSSVSSIGGHANWSNVSDQRFKRNVKEDVVGLEFIKALRPVTYNLDLHSIDDWYYKNLKIRDVTLDENGYEKEKIVYSGFLAQEVEASAEQLGYDFSGVDKPKNDKDFYALRYAEFVVPLVKAVQELDAKATALEVENAALKQLLQSYDDRLKALEE